MSDKYNNILVIAHGRTGSNLLFSLIYKYFKSICTDEKEIIKNIDPTTSKNKVLDYIKNKIRYLNNITNKIAIVHIKPEHMRPFKITLNDVVNLEVFSSIIHINRHNILARAISSQTKLARNGNRLNGVKINMNEKTILRNIQNEFDNTNLMIKQIEKLNYKKVFLHFEKDLRINYNHKKSIQAISSKLNIPIKIRKKTLIKINRFSYIKKPNTHSFMDFNDKIKNFSEIKKNLRNTPFEWMCYQNDNPIGDNLIISMYINHFIAMLNLKNV